MRGDLGEPPGHAGADRLLPWLAAPLARALASQRAHATLVHGPAGVGQFEFALALARAWLCEDADASSRPCGVCAGCRQLAARAHPDFLLLVPDALRETLGWQAEGEGGEDGDRAAKKKPSRQIQIKAVRAAIDWGQRSAGRGGAKVVLIHPADALNESAANALLKTLEEPPGSLRLLLTTDDPQRLLPTVRSRCQRIALALPPAEQALAWLASQGVAEPELLLRAAGGQPLEAAAMAADGLSAELWRALPALVRGGDARALASLPLPRLVDALQRLCHDAQLVAAGASPRFGPPDWIAPGAASAESLAPWAERLRAVRRHDEHPWQAGLLAEALVLAGRRAWQTPATSRPGTAAGLATLARR